MTAEVHCSGEPSDLRASLQERDVGSSLRKAISEHGAENAAADDADPR
jgi:hypothetical protein